MTYAIGGDLHIALSYRLTGNISGWSGPGWYLSIADSENTGDFVLRPVKVAPDVAVEVAVLLDNLLGERVRASVLDVVEAMHGVARTRLEANVRRLEAIERELATARADLAAYNAQVSP